jgi:phospholipid/cholesterol/gamma-HCH transport system permease protein
MTPPSHAVPSIEIDPSDATRVRLSGEWTLHYAEAIGAALREVPEQVRRLDASAVSRLDSLGVLQLLRHAARRGLDDDALRFRDDHRALVQIIEDVKDGRPKTKKNYGFVAALERLGRAVHENAREVVSLVSFLGETLSKLVRTVVQPRRLRVIATVFHMEQVGLDAVPLVALLSFLVGAVIAFLGANMLAELRRSDLHGRTGQPTPSCASSACCSPRSSSPAAPRARSPRRSARCVSQRGVDAIRTLGLDPVDLLVMPRLYALLIVMLPLLTFVAMLAGMLGGMLVSAMSSSISRRCLFLSRIAGQRRSCIHFWVGMAKAPIFAFLIAVIGCLEGFRCRAARSRSASTPRRAWCSRSSW